MIMDLIILGIFLLTLIVCTVRGFLLTLVQFLRGIISWVLAFIFSDDLASYLKDNTELFTNINLKVNEKLNERIDISGITDMLPKMFTEGIEEYSENLIDELSLKISQILLTVGSFLVIAIGLLLILGIFAHILKNRDKKSTLSKADRRVGLVLGILLGLIYSYLFLAILIPVLGFIIPNEAETVMTWFDGSKFAKYMYDNNLLIYFLQNYLA